MTNSTVSPRIIDLGVADLEDLKMTSEERAEAARRSASKARTNEAMTLTKLDNAEHQTLLDEFDYTYRDAKQNGVGAVDLGNALGTLAAMFHDDDPALLMDADDGRAKTNPGNLLNNLNFQQSSLLGNLVRNADMMLHGYDGTGGATYYLEAAKKKAAQAVRNNRRDEIGAKQSLDATKDLRRAILAHDQLTQWRQIVADVYEAAMEKPYQAPVKSGAGERNGQLADAANDELSALLKTVS